jgi:glycosyltransferase involved in cell wall biosynthesis
MLEAIALVPGVHGWFVGSGPSKGELKVRASQPDLVGRVHFLDSQPPSSLCEVMNSFNVLCLPSRTASNWKEQFGRVLAEAGACEIPVIGSDSGAIPDVIGNAGLVFPEQNPQAMAKCIEMLAIDPRLCVELGKVGRSQAIHKYSWERVAEQYNEILIDLADGKYDR